MVSRLMSTFSVNALNYLYTIGTGKGDTTLRTFHADFTGDLGTDPHQIARRDGWLRRQPRMGARVM